MTSNDYGMPTWEAEFLNGHFNQFCTWLTNGCGAVIVNKYSEYEVLRFKTHQGVQILYKKKNGLLTWTGYMEGLWLTYVHGEVVDLSPDKIEKEKTMMSRDRVRFTIPATLIHKQEYRDLVSRVFGECLGKGGWGDVQIICRPSQFARFLILRNDAGLVNSFKELSPELFNPEDGEIIHIFDVSENENRVRV